METMLNNAAVISAAHELGFDLVGFSNADELSTETARLQEWLAKGFHADMHYMSRNLDKRKDVKQILPTAKSIISLALNYYTPDKHSDDPTTAKISRYAWGKDYHLIIWEKLDNLILKLKDIEPAFEAFSYVDTGPVMDKVWAVKAGIGWQGKHSNILNRELGSWFFIATIICNWSFEPSPAYEDFCGSCTACIDACPTHAIVQDYVVDSNKCISYQTIENKGEILPDLGGKFDNWVFGCDVCQDVCPWNKSFSVVTGTKEFHPKNKEYKLDEIISMTQEEFSSRFKDSPVKRTKLKGLIRNARFIKESKA